MNDLPMTELPDGSGCFTTTTILSTKEALSLPLPKRPLNYRLSSDMYHSIFEAVGASSMCWNPIPSTEVFDSTRAERIAVELCFKIANEIEKWHSLSVTEIAALNPSVAEYISNLEERLKSKN